MSAAPRYAPFSNDISYQGNSLLRGPEDIVESILKSLGNTFSCSESHTIAFEIGGKMFPVDPRDFIGQAFVNNVDSCTANLVSTDPPQVGGYQFSWSLGTPFLKGCVGHCQDTGS